MQLWSDMCTHRSQMPGMRICGLVVFLIGLVAATGWTLVLADSDLDVGEQVPTAPAVPPPDAGGTLLDLDIGGSASQPGLAPDPRLVAPRAPDVDLDAQSRTAPSGEAPHPDSPIEPLDALFRAPAEPVGRGSSGDDRDAGAEAQAARLGPPDLATDAIDCYTFGGDTETYSGMNRLRGNTYTVNEPMALSEILMDLEFTETVDLYFYVLKSPTFTGVYEVISEKIVSMPGYGRALYSSGSLEVLLEPGYYYGIGVAWGEHEVVYFRDPVALPRTWALGTVEDAMQGSGPPPYTTLEYNHFTGAEYSMELCLHEAHCYQFGGSSAAFSGENRLRGNTYTFSAPQVLSEIQMELSFSGTLDLYYYVLESATLTGTYEVISEVVIPTEGNGQAFYSSGPINIALEPGMYYGIGVAWGASPVGYYRDPTALPRNWALGTVEDAMQGGDPPPYTTLEYNHYTGAEYSMQLCFGPPEGCFAFGGNSSAFMGENRLRGNTYTVTTPAVLSEIQMELDFAGAAELYFYVLESPVLNGTYSVLHESVVPTTGVGQALYSSGSIHVPLNPNMFYGIGVAWGEETVGYVRDPAALPRDWELGTVEDAMQGSDPPPYTTLEYNHFTGAEYSMQLCFETLNCHVFGGDTETYSGSERLRGNTYTVDQPLVLSEIFMELDFAGTADLYFYVLESPTLLGTYDVVYEEVLSTASVGRAFYSSGPIAVHLDPSMFYGIGLAWGSETVTYFRDPASLPRNWERGTVEDAMQAEEPPPYTTLEYNHFSGAEYSMQLCFDHITSGAGDMTWKGESATRPGLVLVRPNPFHPTKTFEFALPHPGEALLGVYDASGRTVRMLLDGPGRAGRQTVRWDGTDGSGQPVPTAVYFYRLELDGRQLDAGRTMVLR